MIRNPVVPAMRSQFRRLIGDGVNSQQRSQLLSEIQFCLLLLIMILLLIL